MYKGIFLDKDGTLVKDVPYNVTIEKITCYTDIFVPLCALGQAGYKLVIVSNQSGIAKGYFVEAELRQAFDFLTAHLQRRSISIAGYYYCPHAENPEEGVCTCRKPQPGLIMQAAQEHAIDLSRSWMVGDIMADVAAGRAAGCKTILLDRNPYHSLHEEHEPAIRPDYKCSDFFEIWNIIRNDKN